MPEFLSEADRLVLRSIQEKTVNIVNLKELTTKFSEITLFSSMPVIESAKLICDCVLTSHARDSDLNEENNFYELKQHFITEVRTEIAAYEKL